MRVADFDPLELTTDASLNSVVIGDVGCPDVTGMRAEEACSRDALWTLATDWGVLRLRPERLVDDLASAAASTDGRVARAATAAMVTFGRRLGALIATLRDPSTRDEQADIPTRYAFLSWWLTVESIWLAGGLLAGSPGRTVMTGVLDGVATARQPCRVGLAPYPAVAPLLGAARRACSPEFGDVIAVADLGHTTIKTAIAERSAVALNRLRLVKPCAAPPPGTSPEGVEEAVAGGLIDVVRHVVDAGSRRVHVIVSVASHVGAGVPVDDGCSVYGSLADRSASLRERVTVGGGADVTLEFVHDGTAAASVTGLRNSATITAGTWLGVGFLPAKAPPLLDLGAGLWIGHG